MVYITGDTHGDFRNIAKFCDRMGTTRNDTMIILGDSGINYFPDIRSHRYKNTLRDIPITIFAIHGNHEERPEMLPGYTNGVYWGADILYEEQYPYILFGLDGEVYKIPDSKGNLRQSLVIGGAYSVDKNYRLMHGDMWYPTEQPSDEIKYKVENVLSCLDWRIDTILSHTCPYSYIPTEWFIRGIDQSTVDQSTELWLESILKRLNSYKKWYCGHYHGEKKKGKVEFLYKSVRQF